MNLRLIGLLGLLCLSVTACAQTALPPPVAVADQTTLDERAALSAELLYQSAATVALAANRAGIIPDSARPRVAAADRKAFAAVQAMRAAYDAGNASSYASAGLIATAAINDFLAALRS